jgi:hypothetical protein
MCLRASEFRLRLTQFAYGNLPACPRDGSRARGADLVVDSYQTLVVDLADLQRGKGHTHGRASRRRVERQEQPLACLSGHCFEEPGARPTESDFEQAALKAAIAAEKVPENDAKKLRTRRHVSRSGQLAPFGDALQIKHEQRMRFEQRVRERAYFLWQDAGRADDPADEYWYRACEIERSTE